MNVKFGTPAPIPYRLPEFGGLRIFLRSLGSITADTDEERMKDIIRNDALLMLSQHLTEHSEKTGYDDFPSLCEELGDRISGELTAKHGFNCAVSIDSITPDEDSQRKIDALSMTDFSAIGGSICVDVSYKPDCVPPWGTGMGSMMLTGFPGALGKPDIAGSEPELMPQVTRPDIVSSGTPAQHYQPKFCPECGNKLPEFRVNFCPECGNKL